MAKWTLKKIVRDWKTRILLGAFFVFFATFSFLFRQQNISLPLDEMRSRYEDTQKLFNIITDTEFETESGQEVYDLLAKQQRLLGMQRFILAEQEGNTVSNLERVVSNYVDNGLELANIQQELWERTDFSAHSMVANTLPQKTDIAQEISFLTYLQKYDLNIEWNPFSASQLLKEELELITGVVLFIFVALLGADQFTQDQKKNWSVTQGIPISWKKQWHQKSAALWGMMWAVLLSGTLLSYLSSLTRETPGSLFYPVSIYKSGTFMHIPLWQYGLLLIGAGMGLSFLLMLLATGLSWMNRNVYLTIGCVIAIYYLPFIWTIIPAFSSFQPSLYLHLSSVFKGMDAEKFGLNGIAYWKIPIVYLLTWGILEGIFHFVFDLIPTQTSGLKRRETV